MDELVTVKIYWLKTLPPWNKENQIMARATLFDIEDKDGNFVSYGVLRPAANDKKHASVDEIVSLKPTDTIADAMAIANSAPGEFADTADT